MGTLIESASELAEAIKKQQILSGQFHVKFADEDRVIRIGWDGRSFCANDGGREEQVFDEFNIDVLLPLQLIAAEA